MTELKVIGGRRSHDTLREQLAEMTPATILDAPAGTGVLSEFLSKRGWNVQCADIDAGNFHAATFSFTRTNLNRGLPYRDNAFEVVVCANGLHRLFNPAGAIREFFRVLRPGGSLLITVNNYASIDCRLRFLFYGSIANTINESRFGQTVRDPEANVRTHLFFPQLANLLEAAGFKIKSILPAEVKKRQRYLAPLAWLIRLCSYFIRGKRMRRNRVDVTRTAPILPGGSYLFVKAVKPELPSSSTPP